MLTLFGGTITQPLDDFGAVMPAGTLTFTDYVTGDPKTVYHDAARDVPWADPVVLDGNGRAVIFLDNDGPYDIVCRNADGDVVWTLHNIVAARPAGTSA